MKEQDIVVVVPVYSSVLSDDEYASLRQCVTLLSRYDIIMVKPESLDVSSILSRYPSLKIEPFPDSHFSSLRAYNKLVLDESFYLRFLKYQYMLIYQLDAYVFRDELLLWANKGYDYIGAPWIPPCGYLLTKSGRLKVFIKHLVYTILNDDRRKLKKYCNYQVGNGGFSLRKIRKMIEITHFYKRKINLFMEDDKPFYPEDLFLLLELTSWKYRLHKPGFKEALKFSMEENPEWGYRYNSGKLPFGCHDWNHQDYSPFWKSFISVSE